jgi:hypothetical protein
MADDEATLRIDAGYPLARLIEALSGSGERASERAAQWRRVLAGMIDGSLRIGSRSPVEATPAWVTLEVVHGGFATGNLAAAGPLERHEQDRLSSLARPPQATERAALNLYFLGPGRAELETMLADGHMRVRVPEEAALLITTWLLQHGETERAAGLIEAVAPFLDRLRFYPLPYDRPLRLGEGIALETAHESVSNLRAKRPQPSVDRMNESLLVWAPLYDRAVALFLETVEGEEPSLRRSASGELARAQNGQPIVQGGWPCRRFPEGWLARAHELLRDYERERSRHQLCAKPERSKENFARLRRYLEICVTDTRSLTGSDVGMIRKILASFVARHGAPGSARHEATRSIQRVIARQPTHVAIARVVADRLARFAPDQGLLDVDAQLHPLTHEEAAAIGGSAPIPIPTCVRAKALRCMEAPVATLVERGLVRSSEVMAKVLPAWTVSVRAAAIADPALQRVYAASYLAFRRRRSLLLLHLASQVQHRELPWIAAIEPWIGSDEVSRATSRATLNDAASIALRAFPHTLTPNKLVTELRGLAVGAGLSLPLVEELAADIFMGAFSETFLRAARAAGELLGGSLYERYYGLSYERVLSLDDLESDRFGKPVSPGFAALCAELANAEPARGSSVARNGTLIEQAQILTTHNLAVLFAELDLAHSLDLPDLARRTFEWVCRRQQLVISDRRAALRNMKNTAYAWRQMLFYLSLVDGLTVGAFVEWTHVHLSKQKDELQRRFAPVLSGLRATSEGERFGADGLHPRTGGRRFLAWSIGRHSLLPAVEVSRATTGS